MKYVLRVLVVGLLFCSFTTTTASAADIRIGTYLQPDLARLVLFSAESRGSFDAAGVDVKLVESAFDNSLQDLIVGKTDATIFIAPIFGKVDEGTYCGKLVFPLSRTMPAGLVAKVPTLAELDGTTVAIAGPQSVVAAVTGLVLQSAGVKTKPVSVSGTGPRMDRMFNEEHIKASYLYQPRATIASKMQPVGDKPRIHLLVAPGKNAPVFPADGIMVPCAFIEQHPDVVQKVVETLKTEMVWLRQPENRGEVIRMLLIEGGVADMVKRYREGGNYFGYVLPDTETAEDIVAEMYEEFLYISSEEPLSIEAQLQAVELVLGREVSEVELPKFYDLRWFQ